MSACASCGRSARRGTEWSIAGRACEHGIESGRVGSDRIGSDRTSASTIPKLTDFFTTALKCTGSGSLSVEQDLGAAIGGMVRGIGRLANGGARETVTA